MRQSPSALAPVLIAIGLALAACKVEDPPRDAAITDGPSAAETAEAADDAGADQNADAAPVVLPGLCDGLRCPNGCCLGNVCQSGTRPEACGTGGLPCAICTPADNCDPIGRFCTPTRPF